MLISQCLYFSLDDKYNSTNYKWKIEKNKKEQILHGTGIGEQPREASPV
jgi:hypothetical protein